MDRRQWGEGEVSGNGKDPVLFQTKTMVGTAGLIWADWISCCPRPCVSPGSWAEWAVDAEPALPEEVAGSAQASGGSLPGKLWPLLGWMAQEPGAGSQAVWSKV